MPKKISFMSKYGPVSFMAGNRKKGKKKKGRLNKRGRLINNKNKKVKSVAYYEKMYDEMFRKGLLPKKKKPYLRYTNPAYSPWATTNANNEWAPTHNTSQAAWDAFDTAVAKAGISLPTNVKGAWGSDVTDALDKWNTYKEDKAYKEDPSSNPWRQEAERLDYEKKIAKAKETASEWPI